MTVKDMYGQGLRWITIVKEKDRQVLIQCHADIRSCAIVK